jgi:hypothetical protein
MLAAFLLSPQAVQAQAARQDALAPACKGPFLCSSMRDGRVDLWVPPAVLDQPMIFTGYPVGLTPAIDVQWHRAGDKLQLLSVDVASATGDILRTKGGRFGAEPPIYGMREQKLTVIAEFKIAAEGPGGTIGIDLSDFLITQFQGSIGSDARIDPSRSHIIAASDSGNTSIFRARLTYERSGRSSVTTTAEMRSAFVKLPSTLMDAQSFDPRFGFFRETLLLGDNQAFGRGNILRWRLANSASSPTKLIFYLDPAIPEKWRPSVKRGVESWNTAFQAAGLGAVMVAADPPAGVHWPTFSASHSTILWEDVSKFREEPIAWGKGSGSVGHLIDRRTGEILKADIMIGAPYELLRDEYFVRAAPLDARAASLVFPDDLMGELIMRLVSHETGHALGLRDGNYGEFAYETESLRDPAWLDKMGFSPSVMNYSRANYVAQPQDDIPPAGLRQRIGPADLLHIKWGYGSFGLSSRADRDAFLRSVTSEQAAKPWLKFVDKGGMTPQPDGYNEAVETTDPIAATRYGLKNLALTARILDKELQARRYEEGLLRHVYEQLLLQWRREMEHVATLIGGRISTWEVEGAIPLENSKPIDADIQRAAMAYLSKNAWQTQQWIVSTETARRFDRTDEGSVVALAQQQLLATLLYRIALLQNVRPSGRNAYDLHEFLGDLRHSLWSELEEKPVVIARDRANLQKAYLDALAGRAGSLDAYDQAIVRSELIQLQKDVSTARAGAADPTTRSHLDRILYELSKSLENSEAGSR